MPSKATYGKLTFAKIITEPMKHKVEAAWQDGMKFDTEVNGHHFFMDQAGENGDDSGPRPKPLMLAALAGCTGMDVISLMKKMRQEVEYFNVVVEGDTEEVHPNAFVKMHVIYEFRGKDLDMEKIEKSISLSEERYCGVSAVYRMAGIEMTHEVKMV